MTHLEPPHEDSKSLYIGNLHPKVTDEELEALFSSAGKVQSCKVIRDKIYNKSAGYAFVDFGSHEIARNALQTLNNHSLCNKEIKLNWAFSCSHREDTSSHFHVFVGDLAPEVSNELLYQSFVKFGSLSDARVMWDQGTGRSRGYGFVAFRVQEDADKAIEEMNGAWLGSRAIRCNWANQRAAGRGGSADGRGQGNGRSGSSRKYHNNMANLSVEDVMELTQAPNTTVYVGNLSSDVTEDEIRTLFEQYGEAEEYRTQLEKGFGFVRYKTMEEAAKAIIGASGATLGNNTIRVSWGKERRSKPSTNVYSYNPYVNNMMYTQAYAPYYAPGGDYPQYFSYDMAGLSPTYGYMPSPQVMMQPGMPGQAMMPAMELLPQGEAMSPQMMHQQQIQQQIMMQQHMMPGYDMLLPQPMAGAVMEGQAPDAQAQEAQNRHYHMMLMHQQEQQRLMQDDMMQQQQQQQQLTPQQALELRMGMMQLQEQQPAADQQQNQADASAETHSEANESQ